MSCRALPGRAGRWAGAGLLWVLGAACCAAALAMDASAERERIDAERLAVLAHFAQDEAQCRQRFNVTPCLAQANERRILALESLRQQELLLQEAQRKARAAQRDRAVADKRVQAEAREQEAAARADRRPAAPPAAAASSPAPPPSSPEAAPPKK